MHAESPTVTIGITCYNAADTIIGALESALLQDYQSFEILVVDDGSSDTSVEIIQGFIQDKKNIRLIVHAENRGFPVSLNTIIQESKGRYIAFFDDDDTSAPDRISKQVRRIESYKLQHPTDLVFCYSNRVVVSCDNPNQVIGHAKAIGRASPEPSGEIVSDFLLWDRGRDGYVWGMFGSCTLMAERADFIKVGDFDSSFKRCAEWDFAVRAGFLGAHFIAVNEDLVVQKKTCSADKGGHIPLLYSLKLRQKYKGFLSQKKVFYASLMVSRARYWGGRGRSVTSWLYMLLAYLLAPLPMLLSRYRRLLCR